MAPAVDPNMIRPPPRSLAPAPPGLLPPPPDKALTKPLTVLCTVGVSAECEERLRDAFGTFHYYAEGEEIPADILPSIDVMFNTWTGPPGVVSDFAQTPRLKHVQLCSSGADKAMASAPFQKLVRDGGKVAGVERNVTLANASGTHVLTIPNWVVGMLVNVYHQVPRQIMIARNEQRWALRPEIDAGGGQYYARVTHGRMAGMLGYGQLGRESARLLKAMGMRIVAANTSGKATPQDGYVIPGTGDADGSIPEAYYSTKDAAQTREFLSRCDVLVASLPNTPQTAGWLDEEKLGHLPPNAVFLNVGRGSLVKSEHLLAALDRPSGLFGAAIDVTDPEPLPDGHPLYTHPRVIVTPHLSGDTEGEMDIAADVFLRNCARVAEGKEVINRVHFERGY
ncbi:putative protein in proB 3'region [Vanrija pseudolonga]|uniref:Purtative protein in proB 3'region n=1 Tax=Vanrija pseudolonga TaxID=143232 RepID=A0AAF0Y4R7_9TREE|nr:purtative protein in proB 3'region [Vanrija pseudolonga]